MTGFMALTRKERALERAADMIITSLPRDPERPAYTERQLARRGRRQIPAGVRTVLHAQGTAQPFQDELRFLATLSRLGPETRRCLSLWADGWTQREIAQALGLSQQRISQRLRQALRLCREHSSLSFRRFSHHTLHRPSRRFG